MKWTMLAGVVLALAAVVAYMTYFHKNASPGENASLGTQASSTVVLEGLQTYRSAALGLSFEYNASDTEIIDQGDIIRVHPLDTPAGQGQTVEKFSKLPSETFADSIERQILAGYSTTTCKVEVTQRSTYPAGYGVAQITYAAPADPDAPFLGREAMCNEKYDQTSGIRFFLYDSNHSDRFYFFDIGQYPIVATGTKTWQDTALIDD